MAGPRNHSRPWHWLWHWGCLGNYFNLLTFFTGSILEGLSSTPGKHLQSLALGFTLATTRKGQNLGQVLRGWVEVDGIRTQQLLQVHGVSLFVSGLNKGTSDTGRAHNIPSRDPHVSTQLSISKSLALAGEGTRSPPMWLHPPSFGSTETVLTKRSTTSRSLQRPHPSPPLAWLSASLALPDHGLLPSPCVSCLTPVNFWPLWKLLDL